MKAFFFKSRKMKLFFVWFLCIVFILFINSVGENINDRTVAVSVFVCGGSTFLFWSYKNRISRIFGAWSPRKKFILIGSLGAAWAECVFWFFEKVFGASGVAASPNLALDLLITMPWYIIMVWLLFKVETHYRYTYTEILLLGGVYELGADGILGQVLGRLAGEGLTGEGLLFVVMVLPLFVIVYSIIVLPPTSVVRKEIAEIRKTQPDKTHKYWYGLLPLLGLIPFSVYVLLLLSILSSL